MSLPEVALGGERLFEEEAHLIQGRKVGLVTNHSGVDRRLRSTADRLHASGACELAALFGPEHGIRGDVPDGLHVDTGVDPRTGVPVYSLYGKTRRPDERMLSGLDVLLFDIQDVGARFYTYLYTMSLCMEACAEAELPFVVLDRPNPINGLEMAGNLLDPAFASFVGRYPIPIRHGMTVGELALLFNESFGIHADLHVVPLRGWRRAMYWEETALPWVPPSPNMPTVDTAVVYPGTCFFEGTNLSEGRGTTKPFEQIGAPFVDPFVLAGELEKAELPGVLFRPVHFQPAAGKYAGESCGGVQLHVIDRSVFQPVRAGLELLSAVRRLWPDAFAWRLPGKSGYNFDRLAGTDRIRLDIEAGVPVGEMVEGWRKDLAAFEERRRRFLLYS